MNINGKQHAWFAYAVFVIVYFIFDRTFYGFFLGVGITYAFSTFADLDQKLKGTHRHKWFHSAVYPGFVWILSMIPLAIYKFLIHPSVIPTLSTEEFYWFTSQEYIETIINGFASIATYWCIAQGSHLILDIWRVDGKPITTDRKVVGVSEPWDIPWLAGWGILCLVMGGISLYYIFFPATFVKATLWITIVVAIAIPCLTILKRKMKRKKRSSSRKRSEKKKNRRK